MPLEKNPTGIFNDRELFGSERNDHESDSFDSRGAVTKRVEVGAEGGSRTRTALRSTDFKPVSRLLTTLYYALPGSIYRRFSRQSKLRLAWYRHVTPSSSPHLNQYEGRSWRRSFLRSQVDFTIRAAAWGCINDPRVALLNSQEQIARFGPCVEKQHRVVSVHR